MTGRSNMRLIGITGGVGAGKTKVLSYIETHYNCRVIRADEVAHLLYEPGEACYNEIVHLLGDNILDSDGKIDKPKMASIIFNDSKLLDKVNGIVHPAVKDYIIGQVELEKNQGKYDFVFIEAALLIEEQYDKIADEIWYIYASEEVRRTRLSLNRNYSEDKISSIMAGQLSEYEFRSHSQAVISNNGNLEETYSEIDRIMGDRQV
jgi:dephospho-CoA kinase